MPTYFFRQCSLSIVLLTGLTCSCFNGYAQPEITGPKCVLPGISYQYIISGQWTPKSVVKVCVTGGKLKGDSICTPEGKIPFMIFVKWNLNDTTHKIELTSTSGNTNFIVRATSDLKGGRVKEGDKMQVYTKEKTSYLFHCGDASGGHCTPNYIYQWQSSNNNVEWKNIDKATAKDLQFAGEILGNTFFRRVTTETNSTSRAYSDSAVLTVKF